MNGREATWGQQRRGWQWCSRGRWRSPSSSFGPASTQVAPAGIFPSRWIDIRSCFPKRFHQLVFECLARRRFLRCPSYRLVDKWSRTFTTKPHSASSRKVSLEPQQMISPSKPQSVSSEKVFISNSTDNVSPQRKLNCFYLYVQKLNMTNWTTKRPWIGYTGGGAKVLHSVANHSHSMKR